MHYSLIMIGAHDGHKTLALIADASAKGKVLLVEPVPFLFRRLESSVSHIPNVTLVNACVSLVDGMVQFTAPRESANSVTKWGDQLGSLNPRHAVEHQLEFLEHVETIQVNSTTFASLVREHEVSSIETLWTDAEGYDCELLLSFPFPLVLPGNIRFEFKHADGTKRIGRRLGMLLIALDVLGYDVRAMDVENMTAKRRLPGTEP